MAYKRISQEAVMRGGHRGRGSKYFVTRSKDMAKSFAKASGAKRIYQLPPGNDAYVVRRTKRSPQTVD